jgi:hypothetical protein
VGESKGGVGNITTAGLVGRSRVGVGVTGRGDRAGGGVTSIDGGNPSPGSAPRAGAKVVSTKATATTTKSNPPIAKAE